jgi:NADH:ubiquinone oxidoreductase subunit F (NADH-binding)
LAEHLARHGQTPLWHPAEALVGAVERAGLLGRGGGGFPAGRKLRSVLQHARGRPTAVLVNGCEGEHLSVKDRTLLVLAPHLVLDGIDVAAAAVGAGRCVLCLHQSESRDDPVWRSLTAALAQRPPGPARIELLPVPHRYVASEESALVALANNREAKPTIRPPRPFERGVDGLPTLVHNVETLAHLALIARYGPEWFRALGSPAAPGTTLLSIGGTVASPGVYEFPLGIPLGAALAAAGIIGIPTAVLCGGYGGGWLPWPRSAAIALDPGAMAAAGATLGSGVLFAIGAGACGIAETARILAYLARESAGQCGPCRFGLPALADDFIALGQGRSGALEVIHRHLPMIGGRGACAHPDGAARLAVSALRAFAEDVRSHAGGQPCAGAQSPGVVPLPLGTR